MAHPVLHLQEDGGETGNVYTGNLGILNRNGTGALVATEREQPATFWFLNPNNTWIDNVAAGGEGPGYSLDLGTTQQAHFPLQVCGAMRAGCIGW